MKKIITLFLLCICVSIQAQEKTKTEELMDFFKKCEYATMSISDGILTVDYTMAIFAGKKSSKKEIHHVVDLKEAVIYEAKYFKNTKSLVLIIKYPNEMKENGYSSFRLSFKKTDQTEYSKIIETLKSFHVSETK